MIDAYAPEGVTQRAVDSIFMMPHLGVLSTVNEQAATEVFDRDCIVYLGTVVAPVGLPPVGKPVLEVSMTLPDGTTVSEQLPAMELRRYAVGVGEEAEATITPLASHLDVGAGPGKKWTGPLRGGVVGVVIDTRGRPIVLPDDPRVRVPLLRKWVAALDEYPAEGGND